MLCAEGESGRAMEQPSEILLTLAEVAVVLVGFAGIASVFARSLERAPQTLVALRLRGMVDTGLVACFAAVLPLVTASYPISESASWRLSSVVLLASASGRLPGLEAPLYLSSLFLAMILAGALFIRVLLILVPADPAA
jgi:hypothetical protein